MPRHIYEVEYDPEFVAFALKPIMYGAPTSFTDVDLIKRWIAKGLAFETGKPEAVCERVVNTLVKVTRK